MLGKSLFSARVSPVAFTVCVRFFNEILPSQFQFHVDSAEIELLSFYDLGCHKNKKPHPEEEMNFFAAHFCGLHNFSIIEDECKPHSICKFVSHILSTGS